jgi:biopolymer transport protein ExbD
MTIDITPVLQAIFILISIIITTVLVPMIKSKTTAEQQQNIESWIKIAVSAAEQLYTQSGQGAEKKAYVVNYLKERGFTVDESKLDAMIESAVYQLKNN